MEKMKVLSTNIAVPRDSGVRRYARTGIDKRPVPSIDVFAPGPHYGDGSGVRGDFVGDVQFHGGAHKAVYAFAREELDFWGNQLGTKLADGSFGENLTTTGLELSALVINQRLVIGDVVLEVSIPRTPCGTFAQWIGEKGWTKTFAQRGDCGAYLRVITPGTITPGTSVGLGPAPAHNITMGMAYRAKLGDMELARQVVAARCLPPVHHDPLVERLDRHQ